MMVAPIVAAAGRGLMSMGSSIAGKKATQSMAGSALRTGKMKVGIKGRALKYLAEASLGIWEGNKLLKTLSAASPALKQQMIIFGKGIMLLLRPIGDILAKFVRPGMVWLMKFAQAWYKKFGPKTTDKEVSEDKLKQLDTELQSAKLEGDPEKIARAEKNIEEHKTKMADQGAIGDGKGIGNFDKLVENASALGIVFEGLKVVGKWVWDVFEGIAKEIGREFKLFFDILKTVDKILGEGIVWAVGLTIKGFELLGDGLKWADKKIMSFAEGTRKFFKGLWDGLQKGADKFFNFMDNLWPNLVKFGESILNWGSKIWDDFFVKGFNVVLNWGADLWELIKKPFDDLIEKVKAWNPVGKVAGGFKAAGSWIGDKLGFATGGNIDKTGLYELHAGERVITAGQVSNSSIGGISNEESINVTNYINVSATINNDMDIQTLANRLAEYQETEIRRRSSYM